MKFNQKNYICKGKDKYLTKLSGLACFCVCVCVWVWPYFPLSAVCSYSNQYVSCLHWSGPDNHYSYMVSPQQMQETDRGPKERNQMRKYTATQNGKCIWEKPRFCCTNAFYMSILMFFWSKCGNCLSVHVSDQKYVIGFHIYQVGIVFFIIKYKISDINLLVSSNVKMMQVTSWS